MTTAAIGFGHHPKPILTIGCTSPRMAAEPTGSAISHSDRPDKLTWTRYIKMMQAEQLSTSNAFTEDDDRQKDGQNRRHAAKRARDIRAHQPIGLKVQQR